MSKHKKNHSGHVQTAENMTPNLEDKIRRKKGYRELMERGAKINDQLQNCDIVSNLQSITEIVKKSNIIAMETMKAPITTASENVMDAVVIKMAHDLVGEVVSTNAQNSFDEDQFANAILREINSDADCFEWDLLARFIKSNDRSVKLSHSFIGSEMPESAPKEKKERQARQKTQVTEMKKPENVDKLEKNEKGAQMVQYVLDKVNEVCQTTKKPIPFLELIMDPDDYMTTIDNAFQIAFLARDGELAVKSAKSGSLGVTPVPENIKAARKKDTQTHQAVLTIDVDEWMERAKMFKDAKPMLELNRSELMKESPKPKPSTSRVK